MPALFFPNLNALRLALASGLVPPGISRSPAAAGFDAHDRLWLELAELPPREALAALARIGVQALGGTGVPTSPVTCWAELLPLQPADAPAGPTLFLVPEKRLARFVARVRRSGNRPVGVRLSETAPHGWVVIANPPAGVLAEAAEPGSPVEAFWEQAPGVWVRHGWRHPVPDDLAVPPGYVLLARPPRSVAPAPAEVPAPEGDEFRLPAPARRSGKPPPAPVVPVRVTLAARRSPGRESLWVLDAEREAEFWAFCSSADERLLRRLEAAHVGAGGDARLVVRAGGKGSVAFLPLPVTGFTAESRVPGLFVPADKVLRPTLRVRELGRALGAGPGLVVWVEAGPDGGVISHALPGSAFRPVAELIDYHAPATDALEVEPRNNPFPLARFVVPSDPLPVPAPEPTPPPVLSVEEDPVPPEPETIAVEPGWLLRSLRKLASKLRPPREDDEPADPEPADAPEPEPVPIPAGRRVDRKLASPDVLLHGRDWSARRRESEARLFHDLPRLGPAGRAGRWADLAGVYTATGNAADAAVCWLNALWESATPPQAWLEQWLVAEARAAKLTDAAGGLERWLSEPGRPGVARAVAAYTAAAGFARGGPDFLATLPRLLALLDQRFDDVPVRAVWLARLAAARVCDGDALGLARWRDRVLARLADRGPGLDLDEPSFLRFHGTASADRFRAAREWLIGVRETALKWVQNQGGGKLRWAGLDAETECTAAYALFMLSWGLGCLGDRTRAKDWAARARKAVSRAAGPGVDPAAHAVLGDLFLLRVRDAQEGRAAKPGLPAEVRSRLDALPELARYAVERLREHSRILEPLDRVRAFRGLDLKLFWGNDRLGERLFVLSGRPDPPDLAEEADDLLRLCHDNPATDTVPRVVLTLLDLAPWLDRAAVLRLLDLLPVAVDWTEAWLAAGRWTEAERPDRLFHHQTRMLRAGFAALAGADPPPELAGELVRRLVSAGDRLRPPLLAVSGQAFRSLRKLGQAGAAETLVRFLDPGQAGGGTDPARLGVAAGWYAAGHEDAGNRLLDEARDALILTGSVSSRVRTPLAVAYAEALGFAPPRLAHVRLEEIFQRLGPVDVMGSTNRYFTLRPLQLVDAVVRSVVTDEFALGPAVRGWLDDDEFLIRGRIHRDLAAVLREQDLA